nr:hypothetical protein [Tanacetum cinerariifolium]
AVQTLGSGISIPLAMGTPSTGSGNLYSQWELFPSSGNALCILFPTCTRAGVPGEDHADSTVVALLVIDHVPSEVVTKPLPHKPSPPLPIPSPPPNSPTHIEIPESSLPLQKRLHFASPTPSQEAGESSAADAMSLHTTLVAQHALILDL